MKKLLSIVILFFVIAAKAQDVAVLLKEADNYEKQLKEPEALDKYKLALVADATNIKALVKVTELSDNIGARTINKNDKRLMYESALAFAQRAYHADSANADANYAMAIASNKMTEVETENKKNVVYFKDVKLYADKALKINTNHARANFVEGRWHYDMATLSPVKKAAAKLLYGRLPESTIDSSIAYLEKCKELEPYFVVNYYTLAKAYKEANRPAKQMEILSKLVKLPTRTFDDIALKADAQKMLETLQ
jgi:hypothetical protein